MTEKTQEQINQCHNHAATTFSGVCFGIACKYWEKCLASQQGFVPKEQVEAH